MFDKPFSMKEFGSDTQKKTPAPKTTTGKKIAVKPAKSLKETKIRCPYCKTVNKFGKDVGSVYCNKCGKKYAR